MKKKFTAWMLAFAMLCTCAPVALAEDDAQAAVSDAQAETEQVGGADMDGLLDELAEDGYSFARESDLAADAETIEAVVVTDSESRKLSSAGSVTQAETELEPYTALLADDSDSTASSVSHKSGKTTSFSTYGEQLSDLTYTTSDDKITVKIGSFVTTMYQQLKADIEKNTSGSVFQGSASGIKALAVTATLTGLDSSYYSEVARAAAIIAYRSVDYDCSEMFYSNGGTGFGYVQRTKGVTIWCKPIYAAEMSTVSEREAIYTKLETKANEIVTNAKSYTRAYDKLKYFHDWICENNVYNSAAASNMNSYSDSYGAPWSAVSALLSASDGYKGPVCEGYARAMQYLCEKAGITCAVMTSDSHMWNSVKYGSFWSGIDLTWDDGTNNSYSYDYFLTPVNDLDYMHSVSDEDYYDDPFGSFIDYPIETAIDTSDVLPFYDSFSWDEEYVQYVYDNSYMIGTTCVTFGRSDELTRAQFAMILYNIAGNPEVAYSDCFTDVKKGSWYTSACIWAEQEGLIYGCPTGEFLPDDPITREQICTILYRRAGSPSGLDETALSEFADADTISSYAEDGVIWMINSGVISGIPGKTTDSAPYIAPKNTATRSEAAKIITVVQQQIS